MHFSRLGARTLSVDAIIASVGKSGQLRPRGRRDMGQNGHYSTDQVEHLSPGRAALFGFECRVKSASVFPLAVSEPRRDPRELALRV
jgi:hypothetical protein